MNTREEFPQYYHVEDLYGNVFAVVCKESDTSYTVIQKRDVRKSFVVSKVTSESAVKDIAPGQLLGASAHDYDEVLRKQFGFALSHDALYSTFAKEKTSNDGQQTATIQNIETPERTDVQRSAGADQAPIIEQPTNNAAKHDPASAKSGGGRTEGNDLDGERSAGDAGKGDQAAKAKPTDDSGSDPKPVQNAGGKPPAAKKDSGQDNSKSDGVTKKEKNDQGANLSSERKDYEININ